MEDNLFANANANANANAELVNIIDQFNLPPKKEFEINEKDEEDLFESACLLIEELVKNDPIAYIQPNFHETILDSVIEMLHQLFDENKFYINKHEYDEDYEEDLEDFISTIVEEALKLFYKHIAPIRSYKKTFVRKTKTNIEKLEKQINYLKSVPQPEQRTKEWYAFRYKYLTASNIWKAFISQSTKNQLIYEKCKPLQSGMTDTEVSSSSSGVNTDSPMHWGQKYEPVSVALYEHLYRTKVSEFGCIPHKTISCLAASPDGINTCKTSGRYGRMLEIKNIVNREINGNPKMEYWIQMQIQLEVCHLNECDFLETRFTEYADEEEFLEDTFEAIPLEVGEDIFTSKDEKQKGIFMYFIENGNPKYEYYNDSFTSSLEVGESIIEKFRKWEESMMEKNIKNTWVKNIYWKLDQYSCVLVLRNKLWFQYAKKDIDDIWKIIEKERIDGTYELRAPKKRILNNTKKKYINDDEDLIKNICHINMETLEE
jgi:hypothetical protein